VSPKGGKRIGAGRKPKVPGGLTDKLNIRCSYDEKTAWMAAALRDGKPLTACAKDLLNAWAARK